MTTLAALRPHHQAELSPAISASRAFVCQSKEACGKGYGADLFSARADTGAEVLSPGSAVEVTALKDVAAAADDVYYAARGLLKTGGENGEMADMRRRVASGMAGVLAYEDASLQRKARAALPPDGEGAGGSIFQNGAEMAAAGGFSEEEGLARALLRYATVSTAGLSFRRWRKLEYFPIMVHVCCSSSNGTHTLLTAASRCARCSSQTAGSRRTSLSGPTSLRALRAGRGDPTCKPKGSAARHTMKLRPRRPGWNCTGARTAVQRLASPDTTTRRSY